MGEVMTSPTPPRPVNMSRERYSPGPDLVEPAHAGRATRTETAFGVSAWLVTRHEDVRAVLGDFGRFSSVGRARRTGPASAQAGVSHAEEPTFADAASFMVGQDPPEHTRLRRLLTPEFTMRRMRVLEPRVRAVVDEVLNDMQDAGPPVDLVTSFALPIPSLVICELLGVPTPTARCSSVCRRSSFSSLPHKANEPWRSSLFILTWAISSTGIAVFPVMI
jgi:cytochrome P450